jgi:hypothetical protein
LTEYYSSISIVSEVSYFSLKGDGIDSRTR